MKRRAKHKATNKKPTSKQSAKQKPNKHLAAIPCTYCINYYHDAITKKNGKGKVIERYCRHNKRIISETSTACSKFRLMKFFYCDNYNEWVQAPQCLNRRIKTYQKYSACKKQCSQFDSVVVHLLKPSDDELNDMQSLNVSKGIKSITVHKGKQLDIISDDDTGQVVVARRRRKHKGSKGKVKAKGKRGGIKGGIKGGIAPLSRTTSNNKSSVRKVAT